MLRRLYDRYAERFISSVILSGAFLLGWGLVDLYRMSHGANGCIDLAVVFVCIVIR